MVYFMTGTETYCIMSIPVVIQFKWGSGQQTSYDLLFSKTHSTLIYLCTPFVYCSYHVSVNQAIVMLLSANTISTKDRQRGGGEKKEYINHFSSFICFLSQPIPLCTAVIAASMLHIQLNTLFSRTSQKHVYFLIAWIKFGTFEYSERHHPACSLALNKFQYEASFFFLNVRAMCCLNSQEKQLKAGRGLTNTQWSKIDERHPAWTNHSTEGEASQQTWKVQEAMTGLMVWKMLLMNEEKRVVTPSLHSFIYLASGHHDNFNMILKLFGLKDG